MAEKLKKIRVLIAPLDWGLGHTTRCIPIIYELLKNDVDVIIAGNENQQVLLKQEFPHCTYIYLEGYNVQYAASARKLFFKMLMQIPRILSAMSKEHKWLKKAIKDYQIDAVISDNRYGLHYSGVPCVFITHQLLIKNPLGSLAEKLLQKINYNQINRFHQCWIPDFDDHPNLAGDLSHPQKMPKIPAYYIGPLTRMKKLETIIDKNHLLIILSGPEPQRSVFENLIFEQIISFPGTATIVRGLPSGMELPKTADHINIYNHLDRYHLNKEMCKAAFVLCRSGYSSVMDIHAVGVKSVLIPTPGQTEQEYLADYLMKNHFTVSCSQQQFDLCQMIEKAKGFEYQINNHLYFSNLPYFIHVFIEKCYQNKQKALPVC
jgi:uncharacterized protein (TIGR00661 family)